MVLSSDSEDSSSSSSPCRSAEFADVVTAIAGLPRLCDLRLASMQQWDEAASRALAAATQLTGLLFKGNTLASLQEQVHKLCGLRSLWMYADEGVHFDEDAAATNLKQLTRLCLPFAELRLSPKSPRARLGHVICHTHLRHVTCWRNGSGWCSGMELRTWCLVDTA